MYASQRNIYNYFLKQMLGETMTDAERESCQLEIDNAENREERLNTLNELSYAYDGKER